MKLHSIGDVKDIKHSIGDMKDIKHSIGDVKDIKQRQQYRPSLSFSEWVSDCCLTPSVKFYFSHIMART